MSLWVLALIVFFINIPFGYWRTNVPKFSAQWALAIHIPVPFIIALRILSGIGWQPISFLILVGSFFLGQFGGGYAKRTLATKAPTFRSSCLVWDIVRTLGKPGVAGSR